MKNAIVIVAIVLVLFAAIGLVYGWIEYSRSDGTSTIEIHTQKMEQEVRDATGEAIDAGRELMDETGEALESAGEEMRDESRDDEARNGVLSPSDQSREHDGDET